MSQPQKPCQKYYRKPQTSDSVISMTGSNFNGNKARRLREHKLGLTIRELAIAIADEVRTERGDPPITSLFTDLSFNNTEVNALLKEDGWNPNHINNAELGYQPAGPKLVRYWARALGVNRADLLTDERTTSQ